MNQSHNLYDELGVPSTADEQEIRQAYRRRAQQCHPDKGGDKEEFQRVKQAFDVLGDPERRESYDATGDVLELEQEHILAEARDLIATLYRNIVLKLKEGVAYVDVVAHMTSSLESSTRDLNKELSRQEVVTKMLKSANDRLRHKRGTDSYLYRAGDEMLRNELKKTANMKRGQLVLAAAADMCKEYTYDTEEAPAKTKGPTIRLFTFDPNSVLGPG